MTTLWMVYAVVTGSLLALAAWAVERGVRGRRIPTRGVWAASIGATLILPAWTWLRPAGPASEAVEGAGMDAATLAFLLDMRDAVAVAAPTLLERLDAMAPWIWFASSALLAVAVAVGLGRLSLRARSWPQARVGGGRVRLSDDFGPAVLGLRRPYVVLPRWALTLSEERVRWIVLHEEEHRRGGDVLILLAGAMALMTMPWNPALWWQLRRLRAAVELDCDGRVLRHGVPASEYGRMLLELGTRGTSPALPVAALSRPRSILERRLMMIVHGVERGRRGRVALAVAAAAALTVVACETPAPTSVEPSGGGKVEAALQVEPKAEAASAFLSQVLEDDGAPLVYVDGEKVSGVPSDLDPDRIDRIEVIKGAAALTTFGDEGTNGVIQIFTKDRAPVAHVDGEKAGVIRRQGDVALTPAAEEEFRAQRRLRLTAEGQQIGGEMRVLVDGEPYEGELRDLDPESIARVDISKPTDGTTPTVRIVLKKPGGS
jgi:hypothetical protein